MSEQTKMIAAAVPLVIATIVMMASNPRSKQSLYTLGAGLVYGAYFLAVFHRELGVGR